MRIIYIILCISILFSCKTKKEKLNLSKMDKWELGWRIHESFINENYQLGEKQFDSILLDNKNINFSALFNGLEVLKKLGKENKILEILNSQNEKTLRKICNSSVLTENLRNKSKCKAIKNEKIENQELQLELIKMYINDQYSRNNLLKDLLKKYNLKKDDIIIDYYTIDVDKINQKRLKEIIKEYGFPTRKMIGKDAMNGVFFIIQHSRGWQESQLENVKKAIKNGDLEKQDYAYLYDRIKFHKREKQLYGTQISRVDRKNNKIKLFEVYDEKNLNKRRMEMELMPIELYKKIVLMY